MTGTWRPVAEADLLQRLAELVPGSGGARVRVAVDGAPCTDPCGFAQRLGQALTSRGHPVAHVRAGSFWKDASLRLEYGREDVQSYLEWLDADALRREVLDRVIVDGTYLPSLRDPGTNRSTREPPRTLPPRGVLLVCGSVLLGRALPFDHRIHLHAPEDQLARDTPPDQRWTLEAYAEYERRSDPRRAADVVIRVGRRSLAVSWPGP